MTRDARSGVYAASVTPLRPDLSPDLEALAPFLEFLAGRGCDGALLLGTTGEGPSFSATERASIWREALRVRGRYPDFKLLAGTGTPSLSETIALTKLAFDLGYDGVVVLPPYYFRAATEDGLFNWFQRVIATAVPRDGLFLGYHFPGIAGVGFSIELLARLKDAFPRQFAGIKDSSHDREFGHTLRRKFGGELLVFNGTDSDLAWAVQNQAAGCITAAANLISPELRQVYDLARSGSDSQSAQQHVTRQRQVLERYSPFPPALKALLARLHRQPRWPVRPPLVNIPETEEERLVQEFSAS